MLCEKCQKNEARIVVTRTVNGVSQTQHLCQECAASFRLADDLPQAAAEWSKAIFRLLSGAVLKKGESEDKKDFTEKMNGLACPGCGKTYKEFAEDGLLGCPDCYESFESAIGPALLSLQGADTHTGKRASKGAARKRPEKKPEQAETKQDPSELENLRVLLGEAVAAEDYDAAAKIRDRIRELEKETEGHE